MLLFATLLSLLYTASRQLLGIPAVQLQHKTDTIIPLTPETEKFWVDGTAIPEVDWDIGESYAGLLPVSNKTDDQNQLYFWFFPTGNPEGADDITIWLNGGPGTSSLEGFLQENGPFLWQYGTPRPRKNPWSWIYLTNMIWIEQPVTTGFSPGVDDLTNQEGVAEDFMGFWKNFIDTFGLHGKKVYLVGESYAGQYVHYIAHFMLDADDYTYFNVEGTAVYDATIGGTWMQKTVGTVPFVDYHRNVFPFNKTFMADLHDRDERCGFKAYREKYLQFPPPQETFDPEPRADINNCDVWQSAFMAAMTVNPCFNMFHITATCPILWDVLGSPGTLTWQPKGYEIYFDRSDVKAAINAPQIKWIERKTGVLRPDTSKHSTKTILPGVIARSNRTLIVQGSLDFSYNVNGTLLAIQNMTWGGLQGFQSYPSDPFQVPLHPSKADTERNIEWLAGSGQMGIVHEERGLTFVENWLAGHMVPQFAPSATYRQMEYMLGRISYDDLTKPGWSMAGMKMTFTGEDGFVMEQGDELEKELNKMIGMITEEEAAKADRKQATHER